jgi:hypothetical protein
MGAPYFFRFSGVSGIGPLVVVVLVTEAPEVSVVVTDVEVAVPVGAAVASVVALAAGAVVVVVVVCPLALGSMVFGAALGWLGGCWAWATPPMRTVAAAAVSRC